ncbi:ORF-99 [Buzura suppressaria nucleopolyhedrovirus]|uniref:ORF-102 n=1 Tax=Buzura suppressaria nuclear polyhedrosis virus TaxID=74320 RepID=W5VKU3_NPVBS|nr:ORF-99 [Buzura suppressaria nucleopolyhedrovirus]AHH82688.1 ORF-99 [Buzura suppressaria nucleopolyhedrovirus]AKN91072.1 ORF-102 [Buzura suppressaria nucleopolyhedrovirus]QYF10573.1 hypothetical protein [Buzura suppressaria nucleopolyhedrovirus]
MHEYTSTYKLLRELVSIKRAQWLFLISFVTSIVTLVGLFCYTASIANIQINAISESVAAQFHSRNVLMEKILTAVQTNGESEFYYSLATRQQNIMLKINTFSASKIDGYNNVSINVPASDNFARYLQGSTHATPIINNVFLFAGSHGLGKSHAAQQLGFVLSRFVHAAVVISVPLSATNDLFLNDVGAIIEIVERTFAHDCYVIWVFDELDTYLSQRRLEYRDKTLTQFAEYTGFVANRRRVLVFTMNNYEILGHDYWSDRNLIETDPKHYTHLNSFNKALQYTRLSQTQFLQEGQLSRLYSFVGNKAFEFKPFDLKVAITFAENYLRNFNIPWSNNIRSKLFANDDKHFTVRALKIAMDDIINARNISNNNDSNNKFVL